MKPCHSVCLGAGGRHAEIACQLDNYKGKQKKAKFGKIDFVAEQSNEIFWAERYIHCDGCVINKPAI